MRQAAEITWVIRTSVNATQLDVRDNSRSSRGALADSYEDYIAIIILKLNFVITSHSAEKLLMDAEANAMLFKSYAYEQKVRPSVFRTYHDSTNRSYRCSLIIFRKDRMGRRGLKLILITGR